MLNAPAKRENSTWHQSEKKIDTWKSEIGMKFLTSGDASNSHESILNDLHFPYSSESINLTSVNSDEIDLLRTFSVSAPCILPSSLDDSLLFLSNEDLEVTAEFNLENFYNPIRQTISFRWPFQESFPTQSEPEANLDVILLKEQTVKEQVPKFAKQVKWSSKERELLARAVKLQNLRMLYEQIVRQYPESLRHSMDQTSTEVTSENRQLKRKLDDLKKLSDRDLHTNLHGLDWNAMSIQFLEHRSPFDCKVQWLNHDHPAVNTAEWTSQELAELHRIAGQFGFRNWPQIALKVGNGRTAFECFVQYKRKIAKSTGAHQWSEQEDFLLKEGIKLFGEENAQFVSNCIENVTPQQCISRWHKHLNVSVKRGKWTQVEDQALIQAVGLYGKQSWYKIRQLVPGRTDIQCRERYCNVLDPELSKEPWSNSEDEELRRAVREYGAGKWSFISKNLPGRTDSQCKRRWNRLQQIVFHTVESSE